MTGKSTLITDGGEVGERTPIYQQALLVGEVQMRDAGPTLYARVGDWLQVVAAMGLVVALVRRRHLALPRLTEEVRGPATPWPPAERRSGLPSSAVLPPNYGRPTVSGRT